MNRRNPIKIIMGVLLIIALMSASAFATAGQPKEEGIIGQVVHME
ncbi:MAG: hypothetical protein ACOX5F_02905 [Anaerovoracaceae bacterium]|jgi:hypothetical protein